MTTDRLPRLRFVEAYPIEQEGQAVYLLRDPTGYAGGSMTATAEALFIMQHLDGAHTLDAVMRSFQKAFGQPASPQDIRQLIDWLDQHFFLETELFARRKQQVDSEFIQSETRPFTCFETNVPPKDLREKLDRCFGDAGFCPGPQIVADKPGLSGLIAPHIDYDRGGAVYGAAYGELFSRFSGDTIVILGTNHQPAQTPIILTDKDFQTPLGTVRTDRDLVARLAEQIPGDPFADQIAHRREHSVELAATMIAYAGRCESVRIVPILVSGVNDRIELGQSPDDSTELSGTIGALRELVGARRGKVMLIASADLAHVGQQFGDSFVLDEPLLGRLKDKDHQSLEFVKQGDAQGFAGYIAKEKDQRNVCGLGPIYLLLSALTPTQGRVLGYDQWVHEQGFGSVSFAAVGMYDNR